ncbi:MAG TPA: hypothetical protein VG711_00050 [Phycisphaerales bacterium]|nr:hypothetical protein [Phycisphaerales bacterium]
MAIPIFQPTKDSFLQTWSDNFSTLISATPTTYGLTAAQATAYATLSTAYSNAYNAVVNPNTNSKQAVITKNQAKEALLYGSGGAWALVNIVQAFPGTTNSMRGALGLRIPAPSPKPIPAPEFAPDLSIVSTAGRSVKVRLRDQENPDRRGKPDGVQGATILFYVGETAPADPAQWIFSNNTSKTSFDVEIPATVLPGAKVWLTAFWFNNRKESGPAAIPESTRVSDGLAAAA